MGLEQKQKQQDQVFILKRKILHIKEVRIIVRNTKVKENNLKNFIKNVETKDSTDI